MSLISRIALVIIGLAFHLATPTGIHAQSTDVFQNGRILSSKELSRIPGTRQALYEQTVGRVRPETVLKYRTKEAYIPARGVKATAGKMFEAMTVNRYRAYAQNGERLVTTASLGFPGDAADIIKISREGVVLERYQLKAGYNASIKAITDTKYSSARIATHPDQLAKIRTELRKLQLQGKPLREPWNLVDDALRTGRLTDTIDGMTLSTRGASIRASNRYVGRMFDVTSRELFASQVPAAVSGKFLGNNVVSHTAPRLAPRALATTGKIAGRAFAGGLGVVDVAYSGYRLHDTISRRHEFDDDIYAGRLVAESGMGLSGAGLLLLTTPEPTGLTKAIGAGLIVSSLAFGAADMTLDYAHTNRISDRQRLLENLDVYEKHDAVDSLLRKMIDHDNMVLY